MGRNGHGPKWLWAEMVIGRNDPESVNLGSYNYQKNTSYIPESTVQYENHDRAAPAAPELPRQKANFP